MGFIVKTTTNKHVLDLICPYHCKRCGRLGSLLCTCCKKYIVNKAKKQNLLEDFLDQNQIQNFTLPFKQSWNCGWRDEVIGQLTEDYKYHSMRSAAPILADIIHQTLPELPPNTVIVPLPTIPKHIRERGFDHTAKIAKYLAKYRQCDHKKVLRRLHNTVQVGVSAEMRQKQAEEAYELNGIIDVKSNYLLLDDVWTTGASLCAAAKILQDAGVCNIYSVTLVVSR